MKAVFRFSMPRGPAKLSGWHIQLRFGQLGFARRDLVRLRWRS
jgi:hypothetical protein